MLNLEDLDPAMDFVSEIRKLKKELNAVILAHYYQEPDIQDIADYLGDSLALARAAQKTDADVIVFCGVHFMCETAKILNPERQVLLPDLEAGCSLADSCPPDQFKAFIDRHEGAAVVSYINCSAATKALSDVICTSSNAVDVVNSFPAERQVIFAPDRYLGSYVAKKTGRGLILWNGTCQVHEQFSLEKLTRLKIRHPGAKIVAHPECEESVLDAADFIGSTAQLLKFVEQSPGRKFIVVTEEGIIHEMKKRAPDKEFIPGPVEEESCNCSQCPHMRLNTMEKVYLCMANRAPEITMDEELRLAAKKPLDRMLELSKSIKSP